MFSSRDEVGQVFAKASSLRNGEPLAPFKVTVAGQEQLLQLNQKADIFLPNVMEVTDRFDPTNPKHVAELERVLNETQTIGVVAHQDDLEIGMPQAIYDHVKQQNQFLGIVVTDSASISKEGGNGSFYNGLNDAEFASVRNLEQRQSAKQAGFPVIQLKYPSSVLQKKEENRLPQQQLAGDILQTLDLCHNARTVYTHNPLDFHPTHTNVMAATTAAMRVLDKKRLPKMKLYGVEIWGSVQSIAQNAHTVFPLNEEAIELTRGLLKNYRCQIETQNRDYVEGPIGSFRSNGTFATDPHEKATPAASVALDLSPYIHLGKTPIEMANDLMSKMRERVCSQHSGNINFDQRLTDLKLNSNFGKATYAKG